MNYIPKACVAALILTASTVPIVAQDPSKPTLQRGISVELPAARSAVVLRAADKKDALVVSVTEAGSLYLGVEEVEPSALATELKGIEQKVYIKADAHSLYSNV